MAIETTTIDTGNNAAALTAWLQANATEYLTDIVNTEGTITANVIGGGSLTFTPGARYCGKFTTNSGYEKSLDFGSTSGNPFTISVAYKTSKGIVLSTTKNPTKGPFLIIIGKTNNGTVYGINLIPASGSSSLEVNNLYPPQVVDFNESNIEYRNSGAGKPNYSVLTSIAAMPINDTYNYGDGLYYVASTDIGRFGIVEYNAKHYVACGNVWLEE